MPSCCRSWPRWKPCWSLEKRIHTRQATPRLPPNTPFHYSLQADLRCLPCLPHHRHSLQSHHRCRPLRPHQTSHLCCFHHFYHHRLLILSPHRSFRPMLRRLFSIKISQRLPSATARAYQPYRWPSRHESSLPRRHLKAWRHQCLNTLMATKQVSPSAQIDSSPCYPTQNPPTSTVHLSCSTCCLVWPSSWRRGPQLDSVSLSRPLLGEVSSLVSYLCWAVVLMRLWRCQG